MTLLVRLGGVVSGPAFVRSNVVSRSTPEEASGNHRTPPSSGAETLRIDTATGSVPLGFIEENGTVYLVARERAARWPIELLRNGSVRLVLPGGRIQGSPQLITDASERARVLELFRQKYGSEKFARWYDHPARVLRVTVEPFVTERGPGTDRYYDWLRSEFDNVAEDYDQHITGNRMNRLLRSRSLARLEPRFAGRRTLLEIGCGSGMETIPLLRAGHDIVAVDISEKMLATTRAKAEREGVGNRLETRLLRARDIERLLDDVDPRRFDGGYSTYGALNCEPELDGIPPALHRLLKPRAPFIVGVYNRWCLFEIAGYGASLQFSRAFSRQRNPVPVGDSRFCVDVYAHSVADFRKLFQTGFSVERVEGVPVLLPPSDLTAYAEKFARHFDRLAGWDAFLGARWPFNQLGDHFLMTFVRGA